MRCTDSKAATQDGYTLLELVVALSIFSVIGYTLMGAVRMAHQSHRAVVTSSTENTLRRKTVEKLVEELASANSDTIDVVAPVGDNHTLTFQLPVTVAGLPAWGVKEESLSSVPAEQSVANWSIRYTVVNLPVDGVDQSSLVRQVLDELDVVQVQDAVVDRLSPGWGNPKGFSMVQAGDLWELTITTEGNATGSQGRSTVFHVKTRN